MEYFMLTDKKIAALKPPAKGKIEKTDHNGLMIFVSSTGLTTFVFKYTFQGKRKGFTFADFPDLCLDEARTKAAEFRLAVRQGTDPKLGLQAERLETFGTVYCAWHRLEHQQDTTHPENIERIFKHLLPALGNMPIRSIETAKLRDVIHNLEGHSVINHSITYCRALFGWAIGEGILDRNPASNIKPPHGLKKVKHHPAATNWTDFNQVINKVYKTENKSDRIIRICLCIGLHVPARSVELTTGKWGDISEDRSLWTLRVRKGRLEEPIELLVPISSQVKTLLDELYTLTGQNEYMFPIHGSPVTTGGMTQALRSVGVPGDLHTIHGNRATFATLLEENGCQEIYLDICLGHKKHNKTYRRGVFLDERTQIMSTWSDMIEKQLEVAQ